MKKNIAILSLLSLLSVKTAFSHSSGYTQVEKGKYELGLNYEMTKGDSERKARILGNRVEDPKKAYYSYYALTNAFGLTESLTAGLNLNYARAKFQSSEDFPSSNETLASGHDDTFNELFLTWHKELGHDFKLSVKNSILDVAYSRDNSDISYKMYQLGLNFAHHNHNEESLYDGSYVSVSYAKGLANKTLADHNHDMLNLSAGINLNITNTIMLGVEGGMEFEFTSASHLRKHSGHEANAFLFNQSYKPKVAKSEIGITVEKSFSKSLTGSVGFKYDIDGVETRNERGISIGFKKTI